ncbi:MAG: hypothetical protein QG662_1967, partial [Pseudomonadota bacterium]|nr:hypothetical protein [Pseudomonadota bacterium]
ARRARGLQGKTLRVSSWLHLLKSWSLLKTRGGSASVSLYLQPVVNGELWRNYLLASVLDIVGLGSVSIPGWHNPALIIQFVQEELPTELLTTWDRDLALILKSPVYALVVLPLAYLIFFDKKA